MKTVHFSLDRFFLIPQEAYEFLIKEMLNEITDPYEEIDLLVSAWFETFIEQLSDIFDFLKSKNFNSIKLILDHWQSHNYDTNRINLPVTFVNLLAITTAKAYYHKVPVSKQKKNCGLLLSGSKLERLNRIGLLKCLHDRNFLTNDNLIWTFHKNHLQINNFIDKESYSMYKDIDLAIDYINQYAFKSNDDFTENISKLDTQIFLNFDISNNLCQLTNYSIIPETFFIDNEPAVSEKTYRAILNNHPFILAASAGSLQYLKNFGFRTFEQYFTISNYDSIIDHHARLNAVADNIIEFPSVLIRFKDEIAADVKHNYDLLISIINKDIKILVSEYLNRSLPLDQLNKKFQINFTHGFSSADELNTFLNKFTELAQNKLWIQKYNQFKGQDWPNISHQSEFNSLPNWVQEECINVFDLKPNFGVDSKTI